MHSHIILVPTLSSKVASIKWSLKPSLCYRGLQGNLFRDKNRHIPRYFKTVKNVHLPLTKTRNYKKLEIELEIDKKLEIRLEIFEIFVNFEFIFEIFVNFEFYFEFCVNFEFFVNGR